ncbi:MAG TPA: SGNH/GDSL hydrolase family protein [Pseudomonadales bacterium]|nr:SGNH/GDSL hydrolase family protein [Pseudomonadales bacterium]
MKTLMRFSVGILLLGLVTLPAQAFTSLYVFGDALSATTNNTSGLAQYYGKRFSNGRIWVEVLAQRQGIPLVTDWSYFDNDSASLVNNLKSSTTPIPPTALVVVWCNCSDIFDLAYNGVTDASQWQAAIKQDQAYELNAIQLLYSKGVRTLIMPNAVDLSMVPGFDLEDTASYLKTIHQECIAYNTAFASTLNTARASFPGLTIYQPDFFTLLNNVTANANTYGLINAQLNGENIDAIDALGKSANTNGLGDNYVYWDYLDPTAKFHEIIADTVQQQISPAQISSISVQGDPSGNTVNVLTLANAPIGLNGFVDGLINTNSAGSTAWAPVTGFTSVNQNQLVSFTAPPLPPIHEASGNGSIYPGNPGNPDTGTSSTNSAPVGEIQYYHLRFPLSWNWP